jgi:hypothetical protein
MFGYVTEKHCVIQPDGTRTTSPNMDYLDLWTPAT